MRIFGWAADDAGPGWYRIRVPFGELDKHGHTTEINTVMPEWAMEEADVIVGQRVCQPGATKRWERLASGVYGHRPLLVFEIDDDLWNLDPGNAPARSFYNLTHPELLDNLTRCCKLADLVTVSTEPLADVVRKINPNVVVLPNQLPASAFLENACGEPNTGVVIGWGGGASHAADVEEMVPALRQHFRRYPSDQFRNMGTLFGSVQRAVGRGSLQGFPWTQDMHEHYRRVAQLDIGLAPLRPSIFNNSKSEIKFLEYAAAGALCVASNTGPYARVIEQCVTGVLVDRPHEWAVALRVQSSDRLAMASRAFEYAQTRMIEKHWQSWEQAYGQG